MASDEATEKAAAGKPSMMVWLAVMAVLTLVAGGGGAAFGLFMAAQATMTAKEIKPPTEVPPSNAVVNANVRDLPPIITNLDQTSDTWIRLHAAIVFDPAKVEKPDVLAAEVAADILGFMQTLSIAQLSGSSGLQHLREDLTDRAIIRSDGRVHELVIESLVVQ
jgi:flagellar FliL protein